MTGQENKPYIKAMRELRRSSAAQPHRNKKKYHRPSQQREQRRGEAE